MARLDDLSYSIRLVSDFLKVLDEPNKLRLNLEVSAEIDSGGRMVAKLFHLGLDERPDLREAFLSSEDKLANNCWRSSGVICFDIIININC